MRAVKFHGKLLFLSLLLLNAGCGYRLARGGTDSGSGQTLAVPVFGSLTTDFKIEQRLTEAVRRELIQRTRYQVTPSSQGDVILEGQVLSVTSIPIIFTDQGRGTAYSVAVAVGVRFTNSDDGTVLFETDRWTFSEVFEVSSNSAEFVPEDTAAIDRLARRFAESLVASLSNASP